MPRHRCLVLAATAAVVAIGLAPAPGIAGEPPPSPAGVPEEAPAPEPACPPIPGVAPLLRAGGVVLVGEIHGTAESPAFVGDLVCHALGARLPVTLALEIPRQEEAAVAAFLGSPGAAEDRAALLASPFWQEEYQDGRRSAAKLALIERARELRGQGLPLAVVLLDDLAATSGQERDVRMADRLVETARAEPGRLLIALTGNLHTRTARGAPWDPDYEWLGYLAAPKLDGRSLTALDVSSPGGSAWICTGADPASCGERPMGGRGEAGAAPGVELYETADETGYHGVYRLPGLTASPPAKTAAP